MPKFVSKHSNKTLISTVEKTVSFRNMLVLVIISLLQIQKIKKKTFSSDQISIKLYNIKR